MSRGYDARRKARRQQARAPAEPQHQERRTGQRRLVEFIPVLLIVAIFAVVGILAFGTGSGVSKKQVKQEVAGLLDGIPQRGAVLGSPSAPVTVWVYADLECPTVKLFVENYLPPIVETWVRNGDLRLDYRSLKTDTLDEEVFFKQETAALAAGRQDRMWDYLLTFVRQQGEVRTDYATNEFLGEIASQIPGLELAKWNSDRYDALLSKQVALGVHSGLTNGLRSTPSLRIGFTEGQAYRRVDSPSIKKEIETSLRSDLESLQRESDRDFPTLRTATPEIEAARNTK